MEHSRCTRVDYLKLCAVVYYKKVVLRFILGSPIKSYCHQTIQGKKEVLIPNFIVTRQTKEKRRFSYLILLSPDKQREKNRLHGHQHHTAPTSSHCTTPHHCTSPHCQISSIWTTKEHHIFTQHHRQNSSIRTLPKLINLNPTTTPH